MATRKSRKDSKKRARGSEPMIRNVPQNGPPSERISESELGILHALKTETESIKKRQGSLQRELTLASADLIRKGDELKVKIKEIAAKYGLKTGEREFSFKTGEIRAAKK